MERQRDRKRLRELEPLALTPGLRVTREAHRQLSDRRALHDILDAGLVAHVAVVRDGHAVVLPIGYARSGEHLLLHGSSGGGLFRDAARGMTLTATVTHLDGLVYSRSLFECSMNYRSAMVTGVAEVVPDAEKLDALRLLCEHLMPGRWVEVRPTTRKELAATMVLRLPLEQASVKVRSGGTAEPADDGESRDVWSGILPLGVRVGEPVPSPDVPTAVPVPGSLALARERHA